MSNVANIPPKTLTLRQQAEAEVNEEQLKKDKEQMKALLRNRIAADKVLKGIDAQIADLEQRIADGTV